MYSLRKSLERKRQKTRVEVPTLTHVIKVRDASILQASVTLSYMLHKAKVVPRNHFGMVYIMLWKGEIMANLEIEGSPKSNHLLFSTCRHSLWTRKASQLIQVGMHLVQPTTNSYTQVHHFLHQDKGSTSMVDGEKYSICIEYIIYTFKSNAFSIGISTVQVLNVIVNKFQEARVQQREILTLEICSSWVTLRFLRDGHTSVEAEGWRCVAVGGRWHLNGWGRLRARAFTWKQIRNMPNKNNVISNENTLGFQFQACSEIEKL